MRRCGSSLASRFLSTPSARRATCAHVPLPTLRSNFYPRPPRGGRRENADPGGLDRRISIHALREEGDSPRAREGIEPKNFYPRPPRGGRPPSPTRRPRRRNFYPRPPRGGRLQMKFSEGRRYEFLSTPSARRATAKTETKSLFSYKLYNILHEFRRALIYNGSKNDPNHAKRHKNPVRRCRKNAENSPFAPGRKTQNNSRPSCSKGG